MKESERKNNWTEVCKGDLSLNERQQAEIYHEISHARGDEVKRLKKLAQSQECVAIFRSAALYRLTDLAEGNSKTSIEVTKFLYKLSGEGEPDENVRAWAYKFYRYLRVLNGNPMGKEELRKERENAENDPSPRMRFLRGLSD